MNANFDFSTFLEIVNCDFAQTFAVDSSHRHGSYVKISHVGNSCNSKKLRGKNFCFFLMFSKTVCHKLGALSVDGRRLSICLSACPSVCPVPDLKSRMERRSKLKINRKEAHKKVTSDPI